MQNNNIKQLITFTFCSLLLLQMAQAQRPSFAGIRFPGLNQKDKYNINNSNSSSIDIVNRLGESDEPPTLPFGATQKPPSSFIPVVYPESTYSPLKSPNVTLVSQFVSNRFGNGDDNSNTNVNASGNKKATGALPNRLPVDARNDSELVAIVSRMPEDHQPFWYLNAAAIEAQKNGSLKNNAGAIRPRGSFFG